MLNFHLNAIRHFYDSPSLFHRPETPQMCSTQLEFEWTIDEVSSLNPANVEAYETQFVSSDDPEIEAKAQAAISTFFKERIIGKWFINIIIFSNVFISIYSIVLNQISS